MLHVHGKCLNLCTDLLYSYNFVDFKVRGVPIFSVTLYSVQNFWICNNLLYFRRCIKLSLSWYKGVGSHGTGTILVFWYVCFVIYYFVQEISLSDLCPIQSKLKSKNAKLLFSMCQKMLNIETSMKIQKIVEVNSTPVLNNDEIWWDIKYLINDGL